MAETTTDYGRQNLPWPDLGFDAGVNLHAAIVGSVAVLSDQISAKWSGSQAIPAGNTIQLAHNFGLSLGELRIRIVESGAELTQGNDTDFGISEVDVNTINIQNNDAVARTIEIYVYPRAKMRGEDLDPAIVINTTGNATVGNMTVTGDLEVQGTTTTLNTETLDVEDANITINKGGTDASAEGAGLTIKGTGGSDLGGVEYDSSLNSKFKVGDATKREILTADGQQSVTNKDIDGGTASNTSRISVPRGADLATLQALTRKQGAIVYNQDKNEFLGDTGTELKTIGGGGGLVPLAIDHTFAGTIERDTEYMVDLSAGSLAVNLPVGLGDEQYKIAFNIRVIEQGTYDLTISSQSSQDIYWNEVADTSFLIDEDVRVEFAWDGTQWTAKSAWYPTYVQFGPGFLPLGSIVAVVDDYAAVSVPASGQVDNNGFQLCDGAQLNGDSVLGSGSTLGTNTPDLTDGRFLRGSTVSGTSGGSATKTLLEANLPPHTHSINHGHGDTFATGNNNASHNHNIVCSRVGIDSGGGGTAYEVLLSRDIYPALNTRTLFSADQNTNHGHTITGAVTAHTGASGSTGSGSSFNIEPAYLNVKYLIRVK